MRFVRHVLFAGGCLAVCACASAMSEADIASLPVIGVDELKANPARYDGQYVKVRGFVSGPSGFLSLLDIGSEGCKNAGFPTLQLDLRDSFQRAASKFDQSVVILSGRFTNQLYPIPRNPWGRAEGNDRVIGPLLEPRVVQVISNECRNLSRTTTG